METWLVIPAFNEENKLKEVVSELNRNGYTNIVIVDDCSGDNTSTVASNSGAIVLKHLINRGQGAALKTGIDYALEQGAEAIVTFDADGQHQPEDISRLLQPLEKGIADVALGSRFLGTSSNTPLIRKAFLKGGAAIFRLMYGVKLTDSHNGLRAFSRKAAEKIRITQDRMEQEGHPYISVLTGSSLDQNIKFMKQYGLDASLSSNPAAQKYPWVLLAENGVVAYFLFHQKH